MKSVLCLAVTLMLYLSLWLTGCNGTHVVAENTSNSNMATEGATAETIENTPGDQEKDKPKKGFLDKASDLLDQAKSSGKGGSESAKEWLGDKLKQATEKTNNTTEDSVQWAFDMYESLKEKGLTQSESAKEWLAEDFKSMGAWEYKVEMILVAEAEKKLNELGDQRWECFQVKDNTYFFKRQKQSFLKAIPLRDLMQLIPLMTDGE